MTIKKLKFPEGFLWGSGTSAAQIEANGLEKQGNKGEDTFLREYNADPDSFYQGNYCLGNFFEKYKEDIKMARQIGFNSLRLQISWSRLFPNGTDLDIDASNYYEDVFKTAINNGIDLTITLYHFDMPAWAQDSGGWKNKSVREKFVKFASYCFKKFDKYAKYWAVFNESLGENLMQNKIFGSQPDFNSMKSYIESVIGTAITVAMVAKEHKAQNIEHPLGNIYISTTTIPFTDSEEDKQATEVAETMIWRIYADPAQMGVFPQLALDIWSEKGYISKNPFTDEELLLIKENTCTWLGVNYYSPARIGKNPPRNDDERDSTSGLAAGYDDYFHFISNKKERFNFHRDWEIFPKGIYLKFMQIKERYNQPAMVTECGVGVENEERFRNEKGYIFDPYRIQFHSEHLWWVHKAIEDGANILGYQMWTYIDNWSFKNAYKNRYGFIELNIEDGTRVIKESGYWMKTVADNNGLDFDIEIPKENDELIKLFGNK